MATTVWLDDQCRVILENRIASVRAEIQQVEDRLVVVQQLQAENPRYGYDVEIRAKREQRRRLARQLDSLQIHYRDSILGESYFAAAVT